MTSIRRIFSYGAHEMGNGCLSDAEVLAFAEGRVDQVRLRAFTEHLDACETCQHLVYEASHALVTAHTVPLSGNEDAGWNRTLRTGTTVARRYVVRRFVERGGMGEVYEAFDRDLNERVALKTVSSTACDSPLAVRRLKAEVQLARRVSHPNVCRIYDFGTHVLEGTRTVIHFLTMEFVEGETLGKRIRREGPLRVDEAQKFARALLQGLSAAHSAGILHRDFKSDNVMLRPDSEGEYTPVILDFGLARALDEDARNVTSATHQHVIGTVDYIAPEQIEGKPYLMASDVYSFGVVWFEMLTGALPFEGPTRTASALERLRREPVAPSSLNPGVLPALDAVVRGCLRRDPALRFASAEEALAALDHKEFLGFSWRSRQRRIAGMTVVLAGFCAVIHAAITGDRAVASAQEVRPPASETPRVGAPPRPGSSATVIDVRPPPLSARMDAERPFPAPSANLASRFPRRPKATNASVSARALWSRAPASEAAPKAQSPTPPLAVSVPTTAAAPSPANPKTRAATRKPDWENPFEKRD